MDTTSFSKKCEILFNWHYVSTELENHKTDYWFTFWNEHEMGLLVAKGIAENCFDSATRLGNKYLDETWLDFIHYMGCVDSSNFVNPNEYPTNFNSLQELLDYVEYEYDENEID